MRTFRTSVALLCGFLFLACPLFGQINRGTITGLVLDQQGLSVGDAKVTAVNEATALKTETTTGSTGTFTFPGLPVGRYQVSCEKTGFKKFIQEHVAVDVGQTIAVNIPLQVGALTQEVTVTAAPPALSTSTSEVGTNVPREQIMALPSPMTGDMRNPLNFLILTPGVYGSVPGGVPDLRLHVSGAPTGSMAVYIDGIPDANTNLTGDIGSNHPSIEAIGEFKVTNSNDSSQYGLASSSASFTFRSGTNQWHGSAWDFLQNDHLSALDTVTKAQGGKKAPLKQNEYGFTLGGPITIPKIYSGRDRTFFFASYTGFKWRPSANVFTLTTMPNAFRTGDFSGVLGDQLSVNGLPLFDPAGNPIRAGQIYDPTSVHTVVGPDGVSRDVRNPVPGNILNLNGPNISAVAKNILPLFPQATTNTVLSNFTRQLGAKVDQERFVAKVDHNFRGNQYLSGSFFFGGNSTSNNGGLSLYDAALTDIPSRQVRLAHTYTARGGKFINTFNLGFLRDHQVVSAVKPGPSLSSLGITGISLPSWAPLPSISIFGMNALGAQMANDGVVVSNRFIFNDNMTYIHGAHTLKFGAELRRIQRNEAPPSGGAFVFEPDQTALEGIGYVYPTGPGGPAQAVAIPGGTTGNAVASYFYGAVNAGNFIVGATTAGYRWLTASGYVQDDWKVTRSLTLNLGLRYDLPIPRTEAYGRVATIDPNLKNAAAGGYYGAMTYYGNGPGRNGRNRIGDVDLYAFQPRVGFAYSPEFSEGLLGNLLGSRRTVFRGGFALTRPIGNDMANSDLNAGLYAPGWNGTAITAPPNDYVGSPSFYWDKPYPNFIPPPFISPNYLLGGVPPMVPPSAGIPPTQINWTFGIQRALPGNIVVNATYVGMHTYHVGFWMKPNQVDPARAQKYAAAAAAAGLPLNQFMTLNVWDPRAAPVVNDVAPPAAASDSCTIYIPYMSTAWNCYIGRMGYGATVSQILKPFPQYSDMDFVMVPSGSVSYNGLQASVQKRFSQGLAFLISYTWSKTMGTVDSNSAVFSGAENALFAATFPQNYYNFAAERTITSSDIPHVLAISYNYELPIGPGKKFLKGGGAIGKLIGGWSLGGVSIYQSGRPLHIEYDAFGANDPYGANPYAYTPDVVSGVPLINPDYNKNCNGPLTTTGRVPCQFYINPAAFATPPAGSFGNSARFLAGLRGRPYYNEDFSVMKRIVITEKVHLQFQANFFNAFNRVVWGNGSNPATLMYSGWAGSAPKDLTQASLAANPSTVFGILAAQQNAPRRIQFALKLEF